MKVLCSKGLANRTGPESCVRSGREARHEALTGVRVGQPLSRERFVILGAHAVMLAEGNTDAREVDSWQRQRNAERRGIDWTFTRQDADRKLARHYVS